MASQPASAKRGPKHKEQAPYAEADDLPVKEIFEKKERLTDGNLLLVARYYSRKDIVKRCKGDDDKEVSTSMLSHAVKTALERKAFHEGRDYESVRKEYDAEERAPGVKVRTTNPIPIAPLHHVKTLEELAASDVYKHKKRGLPLAFHAKLCELLKDIDATDRTKRVQEAFGHKSLQIASNFINDTKTQVRKKDGSEYTMSDISAKALEAASATPSSTSTSASIAPQHQSQQTSTAVRPAATTFVNTSPLSAVQQVTTIQHGQGRPRIPSIAPCPPLPPANQYPFHGPGQTLVPYQHGLVPQVGHGNGNAGSSGHANHPVHHLFSSAHAVPFQQASNRLHPRAYAPQTGSALAQVPAPRHAAPHTLQVSQQGAQRQLPTHNAFLPLSNTNVFAGTAQAQSSTSTPTVVAQPNIQINARAAKRQPAEAVDDSSILLTDKPGPRDPVTEPRGQGSQGFKPKRPRFNQNTAAAAPTLESETEDDASAVNLRDPAEVIEQRLRDNQVLSRGKKFHGVRRFRNGLLDPSKSIRVDALLLFCDILCPSPTTEKEAKALYVAQKDFEVFCKKIIKKCGREKVKVIRVMAAEIITEWLDDASIEEHLLEWVKAGLTAYREELLPTKA